jgi:hypothetical protein
VSQQNSAAKRQKQHGAEKRRWDRLPVAIPVFVRGVDNQGKQFLEFATALNISAGGALLATRRSLPPSAIVSLEIPCAPMPPASVLPQCARELRAKLVRVTHASQCHLVGLKFSRPLLARASSTRKRSDNPVPVGRRADQSLARRKVASAK